ncbi:Hypothetical predicted protein [Lecanosticta acicola]|uniref:DUF7730 domain-containing protein n=1 Tax=Lecanosticta acicola TaxID=111012 RepID=A0AAI8YYX1_9PEZI|nr:Hypothetical predicted protein [Lecanosticta acicola]
MDSTDLEAVHPAEPVMDEASDADREVLRSRKPLREEIEVLIDPYRNSTEEPPFTSDELVVMTIISSDFVWMSKEEIFRAIITTYPYFIARAVDHSVHRLRRYDDTDCIMDPKDEVEFLEKRLCKERKGIFRFLDLPAEIRNSIYEELLVYPSPGLRIRGRLEGTVSHRVGDEVGGSVGWYTDIDTSIRTSIDWGRDLDRTGPCFKWPNRLMWPVVELCHLDLEVPVTCRQIYREAMPIYYGLNSFSIDSRSILDGTLRGFPAAAKPHIKRLHLLLGCREPAGLPIVHFPRLDFKLDELRLTIKDKDWFSFGYNPEYDNYARVGGMDSIVALAANAEVVEVDSTGTPGERMDDCRIFQQFISTARLQSNGGDESSSSDGPDKARNDFEEA